MIPAASESHPQLVVSAGPISTSMEVDGAMSAEAVQRALGHASADMTLDTHADLFADDLDGVADALDKARVRKVGRSGTRKIVRKRSARPVRPLRKVAS